MYKILAKLSFRASNLHYLPTCHSTNEIAQNMVKSGSNEGTVIITDDQFAGKGQTGNKWKTEPGKNLTFSIVLKPHFLSPNEQFLITIAISIAIKNTLEEYLPGEVKIKWPNDIYYKEQKIAGILIENILRGNLYDTCIVGIGLNVNQASFENLPKATSMFAILEKELKLNQVFNDLLVRIDAAYNQLKGEDRELLQNTYQACLLGKGEERKFRSSNHEFVGVIQATDASGRLIIWSPEKTYKFNHKEVEFLF